MGATVKVLIAAGGSGGHIFPAVALARTLAEKASGIEIRFVGASRDLDRRIFEKEGFRFWLLSANRMSCGISWKSAVFFIKLLFDTIISFFIALSYRPGVVVGFGGYVSCPIIFASYICRIPRIVHEQNVTPGKANRFLFKMADRIAVSFKETDRLIGPYGKKSVFTGNPIRREMFQDDRDLGISRFGLNRDRFTILVIGGSQGAHFLNKVFIAGMSEIDAALKSSLQVIHLTGISDYGEVLRSYKDLGSPEYRVYSFIDRIEEAYSASDLVVSRSGASALFELALFGRPMILVPYPFARSHQAENARVFSEKGAAVEIDEKDLSSRVIKDTITGLVNNPRRLKALGESAKRLSVPEASDNLAREVMNLIKVC